MESELPKIFLNKKDPLALLPNFNVTYCSSHYNLSGYDSIPVMFLILEINFSFVKQFVYMCLSFFHIIHYTFNNKHVKL